MDLERARFNMVEQQIKPWGVVDATLLNLLLTLKREVFVVPKYKSLAFADMEIPLPGKQKMLCPRIEARVLQELKIEKTDKVLEIGTGSGYVTALLAKLAEFVYSMELDETNKQLAIQNLTQAGINNVSIISGNGIYGLASKAPFNKIFVGGGLVTFPSALTSQLKIGGKLAAFIGVKPVMEGILIERVNETTFKQKKLFESDIDYLIGENINKFKF